MSRVAKNPVVLPAGVEAKFSATDLTVKGSLGSISLPLSSEVEIKLEDNALTFAAKNESKFARSMSGTLRALVNNMVIGVSKGFEKKLNLVGVGFRAQAQGAKLNLQVGYSHPVNIEMPQGVTVATPTPTEIVIKGANRQVVGQIAAEIRDVRPPEPYKGKGIRYADETVVIKETKKKYGAAR